MEIIKSAIENVYKQRLKKGSFRAVIIATVRGVKNEEVKIFPIWSSKINGGLVINNIADISTTVDKLIADTEKLIEERELEGNNNY